MYTWGLCPGVLYEVILDDKHCMKRDGFGHESPYEGKTNDWITPLWVIRALGPFDLDPCESSHQPWPCAGRGYSKDGLVLPWGGNIWLNPPYGPHTKEWVRRLVEHGTGIALIFARVETRLWQDDIFPTADGYLFPRKRISFCYPDGRPSRASSGAPSALIAWGDENRERLIRAVEEGTIPGAFLGRAFYTVKA